ncbi:MAG: hypothetical protein M9904_17140 [Chitinophagaceae bacterium]|nr:hypothetical protein [Chitinophagaceae bacterium]
MNVLRKLVFIFLFSALVKDGFCQEQYYVYIQSQNRQSFYARVGSAIFNSSGDGYLLVPGLGKNTYELIIGLPGEKTAEWKFSCTVDDTDLGFILKEKSAGGMQLLQLDQQNELTGTLMKPHTEKTAEVVPLSGVVSNDPFSTLLANVVNDPSIRQQLVIIDKKVPSAVPVVEDPVAAVVPEVPVQDKEVPAIKDTVTASVPEIKEAVAAAPADKKSGKKDKPVAALEENKAGSVTPEVKNEEPFVVKETIAAAPADKKSGKKDKPVAALEENKAGSVTPEVKSEEPFVVKETVAVAPADKKSGKRDKPVAALEENKAGSVTPEVKNEEPFVIKEVLSGSEDNEPARKTGVTKKDKVAGEEAKFLPFEIRPGEKAGQKEVAANNKSLDVVPGKKRAGKAGAATGVTESPTVQNGKPAGGENKTRLSVVKKTLERKGREGVDLIDVDEDSNGQKDTIRIFIPAVK